MLYVVRHGETAPNVAGVLLGRANPPLTTRGARQAVWLARTLPPPARVVSSPLDRARRTADAFGVRVEVDERWIERDYGTLEGAHPDSLPNDIGERCDGDASYRPDDGESLADVRQRVRAACDDLSDDARDSNVVVVTHVSPVKAAVAWALAVDDTLDPRLWVDDAGVTSIAITRDATVLQGFNQHRSAAP